MTVTTSFKFLKIDEDTAELFQTINTAELNYTYADYEGALIKIRKVAENTVYLIADRAFINLQARATFHENLLKIQDEIDNKTVIDTFFTLKELGNDSAHKINPEKASKDNTLKALQDIFYILVWFMRTYVSDEITENQYQEFLEPRAQELYQTAERKFIYVQTVDNADGLFPAYEGAQKIGEGTVSDDLEADWRPNSDYLREVAPKRINQYMTTSGLPYKLGWVELAYKKTDRSWFHDHDVHRVLTRSGIPHAERLTGDEWFQVDLETAKEAIKAVKEGRAALNQTPADTEEKPTIVLRPEQTAAVEQTEKTFKKKDRMLWNAKMRFGKTLTALQLVKNQAFQKVLIMTHRPVVKDSWFGDFDKMQMREAGYTFGSDTKGETLDNLKAGDQAFIYFASIQKLRYNKGQTNLQAFAEVDWDLIIIDEAHEGTQTELSETVMTSLVKEKTKILELSGTPFNLLDQFEEGQVYTWDYVMEQQAKLRWEYEKPDQKNPYEQLPEVQMYTFEMRNKEKFSDENKSFNFREFFKVDEQGELVYKDYVSNFLDNITNLDSQTHYPFSTKAYRNELRHTLWILPGVKEANALEELLKTHPVFGGEYNIVNVVRGSSSDNGIASEDDIAKVRQAIGKDPSVTKTITLTVRKLTTGVNVPEWTAVLFLSNTNSAMNYLQAAFRAQTPFSHEKLGMKKTCYVFDFAPDRALTVMAESAQINSGVGKKNTQEQKASMATLLNFMPILGSSETGMRPYDVDRMLTQLKKVYAEKAVRSGFEDDSLYNDNLLTLTADDAEQFNKLNAIVGKTQKQKTNKVIVNENGLTDEEYDRAERAKKKKARERTDEEKEAIEKLKEAKKQQKTMISILRGVSIRIPMMIYGMQVDLSQDITIKDFIKAVDDQSWQEFMPKGFTKGMFKDITKYYDAEVFIEAGRIIRQRAKAMDSLDFIERAEEIASLFGSFKNPDKETVLTPWRVVNMQVVKGIGGLNFYDDTFDSMTENGKPNLHWVDKEMTKEIYQPRSKIIDINAKTGLYPLHAAMSLYYQALSQNDDPHFDAVATYQSILKNNIYAIAKTPMAKTITERTLTGYKNYPTNVAYIPDFADTLKTSIADGQKLVEEAFKAVKFDVVIGNPPYQETTTSATMKKGQQQRVRNVFHEFQLIADQVAEKYSCLIYPGGRWIQRSGKGMGPFGLAQINSPHLSELIYYPQAEEIFKDVAISDGISVVVKDFHKESQEFTYVYSEGGEEEVLTLSSPGEKLLTLDPKNMKLVSALENFVQSHELKVIADSKVINQKLFQLESDFVEKNPEKVTLYTGQDIDPSSQIKLFTNDKAGKTGRATWFVADRDVITVNEHLIDKWKVVVSSANAGGQKRDNQLEVLDNHSAFGRSRVALKAFDTEAEAQNFYKYMKSYIIRFAFLMTDESLTSLGKVVPDLGDYTDHNNLIDFTKDVDAQLQERLGLTEKDYDYLVKYVENFKK